MATVAMELEALEQATAMAHVTAVAATAAMAADATVATNATVAASAAHATVAAMATVTAVAGNRLVITTEQGQANQCEKDRNAEYDNSIHHLFLQAYE